MYMHINLPHAREIEDLMEVIEDSSKVRVRLLCPFRASNDQRSSSNACAFHVFRKIQSLKLRPRDKKFCTKCLEFNVSTPLFFNFNCARHDRQVNYTSADRNRGMTYIHEAIRLLRFIKDMDTTFSHKHQLAQNSENMPMAWRIFNRCDVAQYKNIWKSWKS